MKGGFFLKVKNTDKLTAVEQAFINPFSIASRKEDSDGNSSGKETAQGFYTNKDENPREDSVLSR